jgi:hypothetical protein
MPISFKNLIGTKTQDFFTSFDEENNLERGRVWSYSPGNDFTNMPVCWTAPTNGQVTLEIWGAGGSGAQMCCCGFGLPGNAGAYSRKTLSVAAGQFITGQVGFSCGNGAALCFRGCSESTGACWRGVDGNGLTNGCMCAQGGSGGYSYCSTTPSAFCCYRAGGFCFTGPYNANCGTICNYFPGIWIGCGYGGDINICGGFSCVAFLGCLPQCPCTTHQHLATPGGKHARCGGVVVFTTEDGNEFTNWSGGGGHQYVAAINGLSRHPNSGIPWAYCWGAGVGCGCYENEGCSSHTPPGFPGSAAMPCPAVRDHGKRGGHGAIRIKFVQG